MLLSFNLAPLPTCFVFVRIIRRCVTSKLNIPPFPPASGSPKYWPLVVLLPSFTQKMKWSRVGGSRINNSVVSGGDEEERRRRMEEKEKENHPRIFWPELGKNLTEPLEIWKNSCQRGSWFRAFDMRFSHFSPLVFANWPAQIVGPWLRRRCGCLRRISQKFTRPWLMEWMRERFPGLFSL